MEVEKLNVGDVVTRVKYHKIAGNGKKQTTSAWMDLRMAVTEVFVGNVEKGATSRGVAGNGLNQVTRV